MPDASSKTPVLNAQQHADFRRDGFLVLRSLFSPAEIHDVAAWVDIVGHWPEQPGRQMMYFEQSKQTQGKRILSRIENLTPYHQGIRALLCHSQLTQAVSELFAEQAVLFKDKINFKLPGGEGYLAHQDVQAGWNSYASLHISAMLAIDPATEENGCLEVVAGRHQEGLIGKMWEPMTAEETADMIFVPVRCQPGDVILFDSFAPHRSAPNMSDTPRRLLYATYNRASEGDHLQQYYADKRASYPPDCEREPDKEYSYRV